MTIVPVTTPPTIEYPLYLAPFRLVLQEEARMRLLGLQRILKGRYARWGNNKIVYIVKKQSFENIIQVTDRINWNQPNFEV